MAWSDWTSTNTRRRKGDPAWIKVGWGLAGAGLGIIGALVAVGVLLSRLPACGW